MLMKGGTQQEAVKEMLDLDKTVAPGLRMSGRYAGTHGFSITFHPESATLACGDAERALEYSIQRANGQTVLQIQDKTSPLALQVKPDGTLVGDGSVQVNGRTIVSVNEDPNNRYKFAPKVARCEVGSLVGGARVTGAPIGELRRRRAMGRRQLRTFTLRSCQGCRERLIL